MRNIGRSIGAAAASAALLLAGCAGGGVTVGATPEQTVSIGRCPEVRILPDAQSLVVYEGDVADPALIRYQASILETARSCRAAGQTISMSIGVGGRIAAGPRAGGATTTARLRIAVLVDETEVAFQQDYDLTASLGPPDYGADFRVTADATFPVPPAEQGVRIVVGFVQN